MSTWHSISRDEELKHEAAQICVQQTSTTSLFFCSHYNLQFPRSHSNSFRVIILHYFQHFENALKLEKGSESRSLASTAPQRCGPPRQTSVMMRKQAELSGSCVEGVWNIGFTGAQSPSRSHLFHGSVHSLHFIPPHCLTTRRQFVWMKLS